MQNILDLDKLFVRVPNALATTLNFDELFVTIQLLSSVMVSQTFINTSTFQIGDKKLSLCDPLCCMLA